MKRGLMALLLAALLPALCGCTWRRSGAAAVQTIQEDVPLRNEPAELLSGVQTDKRVVSLIFEGFSDQESMEQIIKLMASRGVDCVFFLSGVVAAEQPEVVRAIRDAGLTIGNYGMTGQKDMQERSQQNNLHQLIRAQTLLTEVSGITPTLFRSNGVTCSREILQAGAAAGLSAAVLPTVYVNHRSFSEQPSAASFVHRLERGSVISVKLGQELDAYEYGQVIAIHEMRPINDPQPSISRAQDDIPRSVYAELSESLTWLLDALEEEGYAIVSPERLQGEAVTLLGESRELTAREEALLDASAYALPVSARPLDAGETRPGTEADFDGAVFVGDSVMEGVASYVKWRRTALTGKESPEDSYLPGARFLTAQNLSVEGALSRVSESSVHPKLGGRKQTLEDALRSMDAKRIYLMLRCEDPRMYQTGAELNNVRLLLHLIHKSCPDAVLCVISYPPNRSVLSDAVTNAAIFRYNLALSRLCLQYGIHFIDAASALRDVQGMLAREYCMDPQTSGRQLNSEGCDALLTYLIGHIPE